MYFIVLHARHCCYCQSRVKFHISFYVKIVPWENMFTWRKCGRPWRHGLVMKWLFKNDQHTRLHMKPSCLELQIKNSHLNIFSDVFVHIPKSYAAKPPCEMHIMIKIIQYTYVYVSLSAAVEKGEYFQMSHVTFSIGLFSHIIHLSICLPAFIFVSFPCWFLPF